MPNSVQPKFGDPCYVKSVSYMHVVSYVKSVSYMHVVSIVRSDLKLFFLCLIFSRIDVRIAVE